MSPGRVPRLAFALAATFLVALAIAAPASGTGPQTTRVSVSSSGVEGTLDSQTAAISDDGRYVAFTSDSPNLVPDDTNSRDVFVYDRQNGVTELVTVSSDGEQANRPALFVDISGDGRYVVFDSEADNLVPDDANEASDVFRYDRQTHTLERVSVANGGSEAEGDSTTPSISGDGRYVTFTSTAENLVDTPSNHESDVFLRDMQAGMTELVSVATDGTLGDGPSGGLGAGPGRITADGRYVVFGSFASTLAPNDMNLKDDVFLRDRMMGTTVRVSVNDAGEEGPQHSLYGDVSDDGRYVVFHSASNNLAPGDTNGHSDIFLRDVAAGTTTRLTHGLGGSEPDGDSEFARISGDGAVVTYQSLAENLVGDDHNHLRDIFAQDRETGTVSIVSRSSSGTPADSHSSFPTISGDGKVGAYQSLATDLVPNDENESFDVFVWEKAELGGPTPSPTVTAGTPTATPTPLGELVGDVNCSGDVTSIDAVLVLQFTASLLGELPCQEAADANANGHIDAIDATLILQLTAGFFESLPP